MLTIEDFGIFAKYQVTFDLDYEGALHVMPETFFNDEGDLIANYNDIDDWLKNGGRETLQEYFLEDVITVSHEINPKYIEIWCNGKEQ